MNPIKIYPDNLTKLENEQDRKNGGINILKKVVNSRLLSYRGCNY